MYRTFREQVDNEWLPYCLSIGVSYNLFWHLTRKKLRPFEKAYELRTKDYDTEMWLMGRYVYEATLTAVANVFQGRKSKLKYRDTPILKEIEINKQSQKMSDEQKIEGTKILFKKLEMMQSAFERNHPKNTEEITE